MRSHAWTVLIGAIAGLFFTPRRHSFRYAVAAPRTTPATVIEVPAA